jgi:oxygen-independent coproporphyrinogen-3 oxidase
MSQQNDWDIPRALLSHYDHLGNLSDDALFSVDQGIDSDVFESQLRRHAAESDGPVSLYVHLPFCAVRCLNCDKNTTVTHDPQRIDAYIETLDREMAQVASRLGNQRPVHTLRLGGGTPNYLSESQLARLIEIIDRHFRLTPETDASLEANPCRASFSQLELLHGLGFRRIDFSIGDLDPSVQLAIGRVQSAAMVQDIFQSARDVGFDSVNLGLRYGLPQQTGASLARTVEHLLAIGPDRIACEAYNRHPAGLGHQCAIDRSQSRGSLADRLALFNTVVEGLTGAGYQWIGLDCFAREDDALSTAQAEHRLRRDWLGYTVQPHSDLLGFGTNAISELGDLCIQNHLDIAHWEEALAGHRHPVRGGLRLSARQQRRREAICSLMCNLEVLDRDLLTTVDEQRAAPDDIWTDFIDRGLIDVMPDRLRLTPEGRHMLHHVWNGGFRVGSGGLAWQTAHL